MKPDPRDVRPEPLRGRSRVAEVRAFLRANRGYWLLLLIFVLLLVSAVVLLGETPAGHLVYAPF